MWVYIKKHDAWFCRLTEAKKANAIKGLVKCPFGCTYAHTYAHSMTSGINVDFAPWQKERMGSYRIAYCGDKKLVVLDDTLEKNALEIVKTQAGTPLYIPPKV